MSDELNQKNLTATSGSATEELVTEASQIASVDAADDLSSKPLPPDEQEESSAAEETIWNLSRSDLFFLICVSGIILLLFGVHTLQLIWRGGERIEIQRLDPRAFRFQIEVNNATWVEWMQLPGIGESMARRIIADREENGPFGSVDDVRRVNGIGQVKMEAIRPYLSYAEEESPSL